VLLQTSMENLSGFAGRIIQCLWETDHSQFAICHVCVRHTAIDVLVIDFLLPA